MGYFSTITVIQSSSIPISFIQIQKQFKYTFSSHNLCYYIVTDLSCQNGIMLSYFANQIEHGQMASPVRYCERIQTHCQFSCYGYNQIEDQKLHPQWLNVGVE
ncbi:Hypothetical_protein [Hexamita inflata]|uniref:Hypothetical_protein n=1 Tax=Hexamita inflata TaxID=28002 RepID=A0AA86PTV8_9EUKA|nr:Hypothetical protein HINF_LOCUS33381 [Hexamita inflata]